MSPNRKGKRPLLGSYKRFLVLGCGGSGKSTFSIKLARRTGLHLHHLDSYYWKKGWGKTPEGEWRKIVTRMVRGKEWIIDGSYFGTLDLRLQRADAVIFFDLPRRVCLWRVLKRRFQNRGGKNRLGMPPGCPERVYGTFLKWIWNYRKKSRPLVLSKLKDFPGKRLFIINHPAQAEELLEALGRAGG